ncbi:MAG: GGDEF domain-containing protein, partial [Proteobacteria bacterium]|nr:GGDEF domain-containing protein [Pseudomonadota bacterium]
RSAFPESSMPFFIDLSKEVAKTFNRAKKFSFLKELSIIDELTGLYNRRFFYEILEKEFKRAKRYGSSFTLVLADLNNFKKINDNYGHIKGDEVLKVVAQTIRNRLRISDYPIRYGGDEFAIILLQSGYIDTEKIMKDINKKLVGINFSMAEKVSLSFGICQYNESFNSCYEMIDCADKDLYRNKSIRACE